MPSCLFELLPPVCDMEIQAVLSSWEMEEPRGSRKKQRCWLQRGVCIRAFLPEKEAL